MADGSHAGAFSAVNASSGGATSFLLTKQPLRFFAAPLNSDRIILILHPSSLCIAHCALRRMSCRVGIQGQWSHFGSSRERVLIMNGTGVYLTRGIRRES